MEKYCKTKEEIQRQNKAKVRPHYKRAEKLVEQRKKEGKEDFLKEVACTSGTHGANVY